MSEATILEATHDEKLNISKLGPERTPTSDFKSFDLNQGIRK